MFKLVLDQSRTRGKRSDIPLGNPHADDLRCVVRPRTRVYQGWRAALAGKKLPVADRLAGFGAAERSYESKYSALARACLGGWVLQENQCAIADRR